MKAKVLSTHMRADTHTNTNTPPWKERRCAAEVNVNGNVGNDVDVAVSVQH